MAKTTSSPGFISRYRWWLAYILLVAVGLFFRLWQLGIIPPAIVHDEVYYAVEAQTVALAGQDPSGTWHPWELRPAHVLYAELPGTLFSLGTWFSKTPLIAVRLTSVVGGVVLSLSIAWLMWGLFKKKNLALVTSALALFNPWIFQFSRMTFDPLLSLVFYYLGLAILFNTKKWARLWALIPLVLGFFQYQGLKIIFIPMVMIALAYLVYQEWPTRKENVLALLKKFMPLVAILAVSLVVMASYVVRLQSQTASTRIGDILFFNEAYVSRLVDEQRRLSVLTPLTPLFTNKLTVITWEFLYKYVHAFHPILLFVVGEQVRNPFSVWSLGLFHVVDVWLIVLGVAAIWQRKEWRSKGIFLLALAAIAPFPLAINTIEAWIIFRACLLFPILIMVAALGWDLLWSQPKVWVKGGLVMVYGLAILWFGYHYFFRYPIYATGGGAFGERVMANYLHRLSPNASAVVLGDQAEFLFYNYIFHNRLITTENLPAINTAMQSRHFSLQNVTFDTRCVSFKGEEGANVILTDATNVICDGESTASSSAKVTNIVSPIDSGALFRVYNDPLCTQYSLNNFSRVQDWKTLDIENLSDEEFCKQLLTYNK